MLHGTTAAKAVSDCKSFILIWHNCNKVTFKLWVLYTQTVSPLYLHGTIATKGVSNCESFILRLRVLYTYIAQLLQRGVSDCKSFMLMWQNYNRKGFRLWVLYTNMAQLLQRWLLFFRLWVLYTNMAQLQQREFQAVSPLYSDRASFILTWHNCYKGGFRLTCKSCIDYCGTLLQGVQTEGPSYQCGTCYRDGGGWVEGSECKSFMLMTGWEVFQAVIMQCGMLQGGFRLQLLLQLMWHASPTSVAC